MTRDDGTVAATLANFETLARKVFVPRSRSLRCPSLLIVARCEQMLLQCTGVVIDLYSSSGLVQPQMIFDVIGAAEPKTGDLLESYRSKLISDAWK